MSASAIISANELKLAYGLQQLLNGVTIAVGTGEKVGLVGRNGCGKTSLFRILSGAQVPDSGELSLRRGLRVGYLPQEFELDGEATVRANVEAGAADLINWIQRYENGEGSDAELADIQHHIEAADGWNLDSRIKTLITSLDAPPLDALVAPLSGGEKRRVALCRALAGQPDLLLLDEPTNHLDAWSIAWLENFLKNFSGAVIFVTHDRYFLDSIATRVIELADGKCFSHPGNYTAYLEAKAIRQNISEQSERRRQRFLRVELEWVRSGVKARGTKSRSRMDKFYSVAGLEAPPEEREVDLLLPPPPVTGNIGIELVKTGNRAGADGRWLYRNLNLSLRPGQCTGVVGRNGAGKTTMLRLCMGQLEPLEGSVNIGRQIRFNYIDQARMQLNGEKTVMEEVSDSGEMVSFGGQSLSARSYLKRFLFTDDRVRERVDKLSGGERARLMLAKVLKRGGNMIVLDEPTNDLDLQTLRMLEEALVSFAGSVLVVSHDRYFLDRVCDQIVAFEDDGVVVQTGNYSYYLEKRAERLSKGGSEINASVPEPAQQSKPSTPSATKLKKLSFKEQRELESMEQTIHEAEEAASALEKMLNDPEFYVSRAAEAPELVESLEGMKAEMLVLYRRWEELEQRAAEQAVR